MTRFISTSALALFISAAPAALLAQNAPSVDQSVQPPVTQMPDVTGSLPATKAIEGQILIQDKDTMLASSIVGSEVYSNANAVVGNVNDLIVQRDGRVAGIVVGVGGFMGIGEKEVAVDMKQFTLQPIDANTNAKLVLNATVEELKAAPEFRSAYLLRIEEENQQRLLSQLNEQYPRNDSLPIPAK